jgi:hypothetical protein
VANCEPVSVFHSSNCWRPWLLMRDSSSVRAPWKPNGRATRSALRAKPPENEFAFAKNPPTEGARGGPGHVVPFYVLNIAAAVADEVVMPHASGIESCGPALDGHFPHQTRLHEVPQIVISRGPGRAWIQAIYGFKDFRSRGMPVAFHQERHHGVALRSTPQPAALQGPFNRRGVHEAIGIYLM